LALSTSMAAVFDSAIDKAFFAALEAADMDTVVAFTAVRQ
jgi:hypothetical protein